MQKYRKLVAQAVGAIATGGVWGGVAGAIVVAVASWWNELTTWVGEL